MNEGQTSIVVYYDKNCGIVGCLLIIDKVSATDKTYVWVSVRWKTKIHRRGIYIPLIHWVSRGTGTPKDRDEVNMIVGEMKD
jgi:hypothetical protein